MTLRVICFLVFALVGNVVSLPRSDAQQATGTAAEVNVIVDDKVVDDLANRWREFVEDRAQRDDFSGAVLLAQGDRTALAQAYGQASKRFDVANNVDTKFNLGSMNKMFTGVAICQLYELGKLGFDDPVGKHLPDYPNREVAESVTIHQLLTHTSGLGSYWNEKYDQRYSHLRTLQDYLPLFVNDPPAFPAGNRFLYSNVGPVILGLIIERVSGQSYYEYVREHIYRPAGMMNTDCYDLDIPVPNLAVGYSRIKSAEELRESFGIPWRNNFYTHAVKGGPAGGGFSTVGDLHRFARALQDDKLLKPATRDLMLAGKVDQGRDFKYAYLFGDHADAGLHRYGHNGGAAGISAEFGCYPELDLTYVVLSNYDHAAAPIAEEMNRLIQQQFGSADAAPPKYRLGVAFRNINDEISVAEVFAGSAADKAGVEVDDIVRMVDGKQVRTDFMEVLDKVLASGDVFQLDVLRDGKKLNLRVQPEPRLP